MSFAPLLLGKEGPARSWMYCFYHPRPEKGKAVRFVRDQEWKLYGDGRFYHVASDALEETVVAPEGKHAAAHKKLSKALETMPARGEMLLKFE